MQAELTTRSTRVLSASELQQEYYARILDLQRRIRETEQELATAPDDHHNREEKAESLYSMRQEMQDVRSELGVLRASAVGQVSRLPYKFPVENSVFADFCI